MTATAEAVATVLPGMVVDAKRVVRHGDGTTSIVAARGLVTALRPSPDGVNATVELARFDGDTQATFWRVHECTPVTDPSRVQAVAVDAHTVNADQAEVEVDLDGSDGYVGLHLAHARIAVAGIDTHQVVELRRVADSLDAVAKHASALAGCLRGHANSLCEGCQGWGVVSLSSRDGDERDCPRCGGSGFDL